ncbi:uncharacterized protein LOC125224922 [Leguminivora glycinivorella]|uniref:uncharacterized protein LOC125224922 n=1 Tax=Leguminivora glycinivorella TaxID=1035111 RepID=UPI00200BCB75|nr:uncharacterized protein LOC125224922 [Leguminivora glycinivorella]
MYTAHIFVIALAVLISRVVSEDVIPTKINGQSLSMPTDDLCTKAGFVKVPTPIPTTANDSKLEPTTEPTVAPISGPSTGKKMSTADIVLTVIGVIAGVILLGFLGQYFYKKQKTQ